MDWLDYDSKLPITDISQFNDNVIGFVYYIEYDDKTKYIGKKNLYSYKKVHKLKNGNWPKGTIEVNSIQKNTGKGGRIVVHTGKFESNWKVYQGSHEQCKDKIPKIKYIVDYASTNLELTYLEAKHLFCFGTLESDEFLNDNILGRFYKANLLGDNNVSE